MPALVNLADMEFDAAKEEYQLLLERQLRFDERIRLGALTLNAASLVALLAAVGNASLVDAIGGDTTIRWVAASFIFGAVSAVGALRCESIETLNRVTRAIPRFGAATRIKGLLNTTATQENSERLDNELAGRIPESIVFSQSKASEWLLNLAGFGWLTGAVSVMIALILPDVSATLSVWF